MTSMKKVYEEANVLINTVGVAKAKEEIQDIIRYSKNSVKKAFWGEILESYLPKFENIKN
jgi:hypothetical protein